MDRYSEIPARLVRERGDDHYRWVRVGAGHQLATRLRALKVIGEDNALTERGGRGWNIESARR